MSIKLFEHNQKAYEAAVEMLAETGKAAVIHPTGTGKSFIGFKYCEDNPDKAFCWLSPSRYIFEMQIKNLEKTGEEIPKNIKFFTYKKLSLMTDEEICEIKCDAAILDEYHRGGALTWGLSLTKFLENNSNLPIIGLSATNIRYLDNQRNMAEELFDGNIVSEITLGEAIVRGILPAPKYVMTVFFYQKDLEKYTKKNNIDNLCCVDSIKEEMRVAITYYNYFDEYANVVNERFEIIDMVVDCRRLFKELDETLTVSWDIMYENVRKYYIATGGLIFSREQRSEYCTLIKWINTQRNISAGKALGELTEEQIKKLDEIGMRWESVNDVSWKRNFDAYKKYVENGGDLLVPQDFITENGVEIGKWLSMLRIYKKSGIRNNYFTAERENALEKVGIIWNKVDFVWERNYQALLSYYKREENIDVPVKWVEDEVKLYSWLADLRKKYRGYAKSNQGTITDIQIQRLNELGMRWQSQADLIWEEGFEHAKAHFEETEAADAPFVYVAPDGYKLGSFLSKCREKFAKGKLSEERISILNSINMVWNKSRKNYWDTCFEYAKAYYEEHSDLNIPPDYKADGIWLNKWLNEQRQIMLGKRKGKALTDEQIEGLKSISFTGETPREIHWKTMLEADEKFYKGNGFGAKIPNDLVVDGTFLKTWVNNEQAISVGKLSNPRTREQIEKLKKIGIIKTKNQTDKKRRVCKDVQNEKGIML